MPDWLTQFFGRKRRAIVIASALLALGQIAALLPPYLLKVIIDQAVPQGDPAMLVGWLAAGLAAYATSAWAVYLGRRRFFVLGEELYTQLSEDVVSCVHALSLRYLSSFSRGALLARFVNDPWTLRALLQTYWPAVLETVLTVVGTAAVLAILAPILLGVAFLPLPILFALLWLYRKRVFPLFLQAQNLQGRLFSSLLQFIDGAETVRVTDSHRFLTQRHQGVLNERGRVEMQLAKYNLFLMPLLGLAIATVLLGVLGLGGWFAIEGAVSVGTLAAFYAYVSRSLQPIRGSASLAFGWQRLRVAVQRLTQLFAAEDHLWQPKDPVALDRLKYGIALRDVWFSYTSDPNQRLARSRLEGTLHKEKPQHRSSRRDAEPISEPHSSPSQNDVLCGIELTIRAGERVAVLGPSGSGKSTLAKLVLRLYDPTGGHIAVDEHPLSEIDLKDWRRQVGYVGQEVFLLQGTLRDNITFGSADMLRPDQLDSGLSPSNTLGGAQCRLTAKDLEDVLFLSAVDEFIDHKAISLDTPLGDGGATLSGGQKKRVALARALLRFPSLLVVDQLATDLEEDLNQKIFERLAQHRPHLTILYLGHRIPTGFEPSHSYWMERGVLTSGERNTSGACSTSSSSAELQSSVMTS